MALVWGVPTISVVYQSFIQISSWRSSLKAAQSRPLGVSVDPAESSTAPEPEKVSPDVCAARSWGHANSLGLSPSPHHVALLVVSMHRDRDV